MTWFILAIGALPFLGFAVRGSFPQGELGAGAVLVLFAIAQIRAELRQQGGNPEGS
jgi:hypothetical protein